MPFVQRAHVEQIAAQITRVPHGPGHQQPSQRAQRRESEDPLEANPPVQQTAQRPAGKRPQKLAAGIDAHRRALGVGRRHLGDQGGEGGFQQVEAGKERQH